MADGLDETERSNVGRGSADGARSSSTARRHELVVRRTAGRPTGLGASATRARSLLMACACVAAAGLVATACATSETSAEDAGPPGTFQAEVVDDDVGPPQPGGELTYGLATETDGYEPSSSRWGGSGYVVAFAIFDPLAAYDANLTVQPYLAAGLEHDEAFTEWRIGVRPDVRFHDGTPVDAAAIAQALAANKASPLAGAVFDFVDEFTASADGTEVIVTMNRPWSTFPEVLTAQTGAIRAPSMADDPDAFRNPVGSGPFVFEDWNQGSDLSVRKNDDYWRDGLPHLDRVVFRVATDVQARGGAFDSGVLDIFETGDPMQIIDYTRRAESQDDVQLFTSQTDEDFKLLIALNLAKPPFDDLDARRAVALAIDTEELSERVFAGIFPAVDGPFRAGSPHYDPDNGYPDHDPEAARAAARTYEERHGGPLSFALTVLPTPESQGIGQFIQAQLTDVGIEMRIDTKEEAALLADTVLGNFDATGFALFGSPSIDREYVFFAGPAKPIGELSLNFTRISAEDNADLREAMDTIRSTDDTTIVKEQYRVVQREMAENLSMIFLVQATAALVFKGNVHGVFDWTLPADDGAAMAGLPSPVPFVANIWMEA
jgi:peptide/nickel transport system substrate-binding protein